MRSCVCIRSFVRGVRACMVRPYIRACVRAYARTYVYVCINVCMPVCMYVVISMHKLVQRPLSIASHSFYNRDFNTHFQKMCCMLFSATSRKHVDRISEPKQE